MKSKLLSRVCKRCEELFQRTGKYDKICDKCDNSSRITGRIQRNGK